MATVTVACKVPNGLILRVFDMVDRDVPVLGGGVKTVKEAQVRGSSIKVLGPAAPFGQLPRAPIAGGYALTHGVDQAFFTEWLKQNAESELVKNGLIFAHEKADYLTKQAQEKEAVTSGLEPLKPDADKRVAGKVKIETAVKAA